MVDLFGWKEGVECPVDVPDEIPELGRSVKSLSPLKLVRGERKETQTPVPQRVGEVIRGFIKKLESITRFSAYQIQTGVITSDVVEVFEKPEVAVDSLYSARHPQIPVEIEGLCLPAAEETNHALEQFARFLLILVRHDMTPQLGQVRVRPPNRFKGSLDTGDEIRRRQPSCMPERSYCGLDPLLRKGHGDLRFAAWADLAKRF
jgi:hypothetical protein